MSTRSNNGKQASSELTEEQLAASRKKVKLVVIVAAVIVVILSALIIGSDIKAGNEKKAEEAAKAEKLAALDRGEDIEIDPAFKVVLDSLKDQMSQMDYTGASLTIFNNLSMINEFFSETCQSRPFFYAGGSAVSGLTPDAAPDEAIVFSDITTVFYGSFRNSLPEGECGAVRVYVTTDNRVRYDFSEGSWSEGMMNGHGTTGFNYLDYDENNIVPDQIYNTGRTGVFEDDMMNGEVTMTVLAGDQKDHYTCNVDYGMIKIDDKWIEDGDTYKLACDNGGDRYFEIDKDKVASTLWAGEVYWAPMYNWVTGEMAQNVDLEDLRAAQQPIE